MAKTAKFSKKVKKDRNLIILRSFWIADFYLSDTKTESMECAGKLKSIWYETEKKN